MPPSSLSPSLRQPLSEHIQSIHPPEKKRSLIGPFVGISIILFVLAFGALYFWGGYLNNQEALEQPAATE